MPKPALSPSYLESIAWKARAKLMPDRDAQGGDCETVSDEIVRRLQRAGHREAFTVLGSFKGRPHSFVKVGPYLVDATREQFAVFEDDPDEEEELRDHPVLVMLANRMGSRSYSYS
jgi:hypothetical protein